MTQILRTSKRDKELFISGLEVEYTSASQLTIKPGFCKDSANNFQIELPSSQVVDITASGTNGLDTGVEAADTWYYVFVIADTTGASSTATLLSVSETSPTLPGTYDIFRRVGVVRNGVGSNFLKFFQFGNQRERSYTYNEDISNTNVLTAGAAAVFTDIDLSDFVPPTSVEPTLFCRYEAHDDFDRLSFRPNGSSLTFAGTPFGRVFQKNAAGKYYEFPIYVISDSSQIVEYRVNDVDNPTNISVMGFKEYL